MNVFRSIDQMLRKMFWRVIVKLFNEKHRVSQALVEHSVEEQLLFIVFQISSF